ncbi:MAG: NAD(P)-dependent oxidoreductase [bacterium]|nr:NAD(P)-dependent oxidoreductase [bacterium]
MIKHVVITGGSGFIGSHLIARLLPLGFKITNIDITNPRTLTTVATSLYQHTQDLEYLPGDFRNRLVIRSALEKADAVIHLAGSYNNGAEAIQTNSYGSRFIFRELARHSHHLKKVIVASTSQVYGEGEHCCSACELSFFGTRKTSDLEQKKFDVHCPRCGSPAIGLANNEENGRAPSSVFAKSMAAVEDTASEFAFHTGVSTTILRYFNVFGSGDWRNNPGKEILADIHQNLLNKQHIILPEFGNCSRDFIHVFDAVEITLTCLLADLPELTLLNVGSGNARLVWEAAEELSDICGIRGKSLQTSAFTPGEPRSSYAETSQLKKLLGFKPRTNFRQGLEELTRYSGIMVDAA